MAERRKNLKRPSFEGKSEPSIIDKDFKVRKRSDTSSKKRLTDPIPRLILPSNPQSEHAVNIAVSSRALFNLEAEQRVIEQEGTTEYHNQQLANQDLVFEPGSAMPFIQALNRVNEALLDMDDSDPEIFNIILMSHNYALAGVRLIRSINAHNLRIERMCLTGGNSPIPYLKGYNIKLFLTSYEDEVEEALRLGFAAAHVFAPHVLQQQSHEQLRVAFDLDAVLFSDESERIGQEQGLSAFFENEQVKADKPLQKGPLKEFATALGRMQLKLKKVGKEDLIRTYIVTSRSAASAGERAVRTLMSWGLELNELHFLAGAPKGPVLEAIRPHIFFDDQQLHVNSAIELGTPAARVTHGVAREREKKLGLPKAASFKV